MRNIILNLGAFLMVLSVFCQSDNCLQFEINEGMVSYTYQVDTNEFSAQLNFDSNGLNSFFSYNRGDKLILDSTFSSFLKDSFLVSYALRGYYRGDSSFSFLKYYNQTINKKKLNSFRFEKKLDQFVTIYGLVYFYKNIPLDIRVKKIKNNEILFKERLLFRNLCIDNKLEIKNK